MTSQAGLQDWQVVALGGLNVRSAMDNQSAVLGTMAKDTVIRGSVEGHWLRLVGRKVGFVQISDEHDQYLRQAHAHSWQVVARGGAVVKKTGDDASANTSTKPMGMIVRGVIVNKHWLALTGEPEPGFIEIVRDGERVLNRVPHEMEGLQVVKEDMNTSVPVVSEARLLSPIAALSHVLHVLMRRYPSSSSSKIGRGGPWSRVAPKAGAFVVVVASIGGVAIVAFAWIRLRSRPHPWRKQTLIYEKLPL